MARTAKKAVKPRKKKVSATIEFPIEGVFGKAPVLNHKIVINEYSGDPTYFVRQSTAAEAIITAVVQFSKDHPGDDIESINIEEDEEECSTLPSLFQKGANDD